MSGYPTLITSGYAEILITNGLIQNCLSKRKESIDLDIKLINQKDIFQRCYLQSIMGLQYLPIKFNIHISQITQFRFKYDSVTLKLRLNKYSSLHRETVTRFSFKRKKYQKYQGSALVRADKIEWVG